MKNKALFCCFAFALLIWACNQNPYEQGKILYTNFCENCHMADGTGLKGLIPPLAGADFLKNSPEAVPCIIRAGYKGKMTVNGQVYETEMAGIVKLSDFEITNIINYIHTAWGNDLPIVQLQQVREWLEPCEKAVKPF
ncbi:MAG: cytochrome c [Saprospiraceae bacterium]|nr:cytochrome c [Saprospiraceae bacterium]